jgi:hypothetical protein
MSTFGALPAHPAAALFPPMSDAALDDLGTDIFEHARQQTTTKEQHT